MIDLSVRHESAEHLARRLGRDAEVTSDLGGGGPAGVGRFGHHPQRQQVSWAADREVMLVLASGHGVRMGNAAGADAAFAAVARFRPTITIRPATRAAGRRRG